MTDEEKSKVFSFHTKREITKEDIVVRTTDEPDAILIQVLEAMLTDAKAGAITGALFLTCRRFDDQGNPLPHFDRAWAPPLLNGVHPHFAFAGMAGAVQMLAQDATDMAFWTAGYDPMAMPPDDETELYDGVD